MHLLKGLSRVWVVVVVGGGGGGVGGLEESCDLLQKLHFSHFNHKLTNISPAFKYVYVFLQTKHFDE